MMMVPLAPDVRKVWTVKLVLACCVVLVLSITYDLAAFLDAEDDMIPAGTLSVVVLVVGAAVSVVIPRLRYRYWRYALQEDALHLERGIVNRVRTVVPLRRIQHLDVSQDLLEREFGLGKLVVHTAGTRSSDVVLPGLLLPEAERLRDTVKDHILEDAV